MREEKSEKLKLAIIGGHDIREFGGGTKYIMEVIKRLDSEFDVTFFSRVNPDQKNFRRTIEDIRREYPYGKVEMYRCPEIPIAEERFILTRSGLSMINKWRKFDIIYNMDYSGITNLVLKLISKMYGTRIVFGMHDVLTLREQPIKDTLLRRQLIKLYKYSRNWAVMLAPDIRVINEYDVDKLRELGYKGRAHPITDFINIKVKPEDIKINRKEFVVIFVNSLVVHHKGIDLLRDIVEKTLQKDDKIKFHLVGAGAEGKPIVEELVKNNHGKVEWLGFVSDAKLKSEFEEASLVILPSRFESFGLSLAEAQAYGSPGVAFDVKGPKNIMKEKIQGTLIEPYDTDKFASAIVGYHKKWKEDKDAYLHVRKEISKIIMSRFSEDVIIPRLKAVLKGKLD